MGPLRSVGIIMDGNRRWAKARGVPTLEGHRKGYEKLKEVLDWTKAADIRDLIVFGFSTENWNRAKDEVEYLMGLLKTGLAADAEEFKKKGGRIRIVGQRERFSPELQKVFNEVEEKTKEGTYTLWLALSYGGRAEIVAAANRLRTEGGEITEDRFNTALWTAGMPDPDLIIRTSGEERLSGFLPWQGVYSELFFTETLWPDFSQEEFTQIITDYHGRERRNGK